ncbi:MAG: hypothetical protein ACPLRH_07665 [Desulfotomaculales bacterium]
MREKAKKIVKRAAVVLREERGDFLGSLAITLGSLVLAVLIIMGLMRLMPDTVGNFFQAAMNWLRQNLGF